MEQMATVNANFNRTDKFEGIYNFQVDSIYVFEGAARNEVFRPHPKYAYCVVIDGYSDNSQGGGWLGGNQTIYHSWPQSPNFASGPFGPGATDGLTHEFGHSRGGVDLYGMRVEGSKNPVNGQTFEPVNSIMNFPYDNIVWDEYTTNLLNSTGPDPIVGDQWIVRPFPATIGLKAVDNQGEPLQYALLEVYPVDWFLYSVSPTPILRYSTGSDGQYIFRQNPFQPASSGYPWNMRYSNFLVKATYNSTVVYKWLPLYDVQNDYFRNGANSFYNTLIQFPVSTPAIQLSSINATTFNSGDPITVSFTATGTFEPTNQFTLFVVDKNNNSFEAGVIEGTSGATITGSIWVEGSVENKYRVRIVSTKPKLQSDDYLISVNPAPAQPLTIGKPSYSCTTGAISFNVSGGNGSAITLSAPGITRTHPTDYSGFVENELRRDPKVIPITATQAGISVTYNFDLRTACGAAPLPPVLVQPIPDQVFTVGQSIPGSGFAVGQYFFDPTPYTPTYNPNWHFQVDGLPEGLYISSERSSNSASPDWTISGTPSTIGRYTVTIRASTAAFPNTEIRGRFTINIQADAIPTGQLTLLKPSYNCQTGAITFHTNGGNGFPISYSAPGIIRSSSTSNTGIVEQELRNDPKSILLEAFQNGQRSTYLFDLKTYCSEPELPVGTLLLLNPTYNCQSGAIQFHTSGGNGSTIEFMAPGITGWTSNPNQYVDRESRSVADVQPFTLMARQSGVTVSLIWNLTLACGRSGARLSSPVSEGTSELSVLVLGNPVEGNSIELEINGVSHQAVQLDLVDLQGRIIYQQHIDRAETTEHLSVPTGNSRGLLLLTIRTATHRQLVKVLKQ
ncbi:hypothetical protein [Spirosoma utsteinense]|uniref:T9SS type A sorting domain-containing protein n=1 Tax=Spirosoma utsteinense TaxID=2585773 RepID=A0ABR6W6C7_9BACT|nr:hypothetical protein [Spirosoma utsteinense]MBC3789070.1 hypothetical protein [Spirosoma utsteinense]MBC3792141.1 hypothetical protein [Spirosoma utsteinense]